MRLMGAQTFCCIVVFSLCFPASLSQGEGYQVLFLQLHHPLVVVAIEYNEPPAYRKKIWVEETCSQETIDLVLGCPSDVINSL